MSAWPTGHRDTNQCFLVEILKGAWAWRRNWEYGAANCVSPHVALAESRCHSLPHQLPVLICGPCQQAGASQELRKSQMMSHTATAQHACAKHVQSHGCPICGRVGPSSQQLHAAPAPSAWLQASQQHPHCCAPLSRTRDAILFGTVSLLAYREVLNLQPMAQCTQFGRATCISRPCIQHVSCRRDGHKACKRWRWHRSGQRRLSPRPERST